MNIHTSGKINNFYGTQTKDVNSVFDNRNHSVSKDNKVLQDNFRQINTHMLNDKIQLLESEKMNRSYEEMGVKKTNQTIDLSALGRGGFRHSSNFNNDTDDSAPTQNTPIVPSSYTSGDSLIDDSNEYNININFDGDLWTEELMNVFTSTADFLSSIITSDIASDGFDDLSITATLSNIDGEGGVLGQAGLTSVWSDTGLAAGATMEFDIVDIDSYQSANTLEDIVLHEMLHAVGFGTLWEEKDLIETTIDDNGTRTRRDDTYESFFTGEAATLYNEGINPIVETDGGVGTELAHWDEETYSTELMSGYVNDENNLSMMTLGSLEDLGYEINYDGLNAVV